MSKLFRDTLAANADFYLDDGGNEITREEFIAQNADGWRSHMLYIGGGFSPLKVAVLTCNARGFYSADWGSAVSAMEEWARNTDRFDWIAEDDPDDEFYGEYELTIQDIPETIGGIGQ